MGIFGIVMFAVGLVFKGFSLGFRVLAGLQQGGLLAPVVIFCVGIGVAMMFPERPIVAAFSVVLGFAGAFVWVGLFNKKIKASYAEMLKKREKSAGEKLHSSTPHGVIFGKEKRKYIAKSENEDGHILVCGGVGSGKSSCIAIPTLRAWGESVFAIDIKGELYEHSKDFRQNIKVFNPLADTSHGYDPYFCLRTSHNPTQEARAIALAIIPLPHETKDPFWVESAQNLFTACILHYNAKGYSFLETIRQMQSVPIKTLVQEISESPEVEARYFVSSFLGMEDKVLSGIMAEVGKNIVPFATDRNLISALSRSKNITPEDLEFGSDIFIQIPEHLLRQWKTLLTLIVSQFLTHFEQRAEGSASPILFLLDEFPRLGKIAAMLDGLATLRSKKITIALIIQSLAQLDVIYGKNERKVISDTCAYKAILSATDADTQDYFSRLVGTYDRVMTSHGENYDPFGLGRGKSTNQHQQERRTIKPEEFATLRDIILLTPHGMARVEKLPYYL